MKLSIIPPKQALNKAYLKQRPLRSEINLFKQNLIRLLEKVDEIEREENQKTHIRDFLRDTFYKEKFEINTKDNKDLVIHLGKTNKEDVGVIIETKRPGNKSEMVSSGRPNVKAFHELILYYFDEREKAGNNQLKQLIISNVYEWYIIDANIFDKNFYRNPRIKKLYETYCNDKKDTPFFYEELSKILAESEADVPCTFFDIRQYGKILRNEDLKDDKSLIVLYKILTPNHLLKQSFANDSNSLDRTFYTELLHIIGLYETKEGGKKLIQRRKPGERNAGSLLENAINQLDTLDKVNRLPNPALFGNTHDERMFNIGLELVITWLNRILFLKLLEAQLLTYFRGDQTYAFLNNNQIKEYDDLNTLFFDVLARHPEMREADLREFYKMVPYLNSSLFEPSAIEQSSVFISNLRDNKKLPVISGTVLKDTNGRKRSGELNSLEYLLEFLNAYDFSSEGSVDIQEDNKTLINASVLGLIFEKINGYKDGSFFTPGFITMYMSRETLRQAVVQKFNERFEWNCKGFDDLREDLHQYITGHDKSRSEARKTANSVINSLKVCDPAVGSGHFLVSALNEIIYIKSELHILQDRNGKSLSNYKVEVINDELTITDTSKEDEPFFRYIPGDTETGRVQEALFHEKQTIIENCLFGVDINPNSVKICRLRLWIELLKNAYYKTSDLKELETLPNIDINIKCGNSLVSRFTLEADLKQALKKSKWDVQAYRLAVMTYLNAQNKNEKREMEKLIETIKSGFESEIARNDKRLLNLNKQKGDLLVLTTQTSLFEQTPAQKTAWEKRVKKLAAEINALETELEEIKNNRIYENAFEWRFEFPEVLNDEGDFIGFDVVIGNPPYIRQEEFPEIKPYLSGHFEVFSGMADLYTYFVEQGISLLKPKGKFIFILPNKWMRAGYGLKLRQFIKGNAIDSILDFGDLPVFEEATTYPCILQLSKDQPVASFEAVNLQTLYYPMGIEVYLKENKMKVLSSDLQSEGWALLDSRTQQLLAKLKSAGIPLGEYVNGKIFYGIKTGFNEAFVIDKNTRDRLIAEDPKSAEIIKPFLGGRDIKRYQQPISNKFLIFTRRGIDINIYPAIVNHLMKYRKQLEPKPADFTGSDWPGRKPGSYKWYEIQDAVDYYEEFEKPKIMLPDISLRCEALLDSDNGYYCVNTAYIIPGLSLSDLAILNSSLVQFFYSNLTQSIQGGYLRFIRQYLEQIPIIKTGILDEKVSKIIELKRNNPNADTSGMEYEIDQTVYQLYDLTPEEIEIIEN
jgi:hypothetical protein